MSDNNETKIYTISDQMIECINVSVFRMLLRLHEEGCDDIINMVKVLSSFEIVIDDADQLVVLNPPALELLPEEVELLSARELLDVEEEKRLALEAEEIKPPVTFKLGETTQPKLIN